MITVDEERPMVVVASLTPLAGFTLGDGLILPSPILVINNLVYMWDVGPPSEDGKWEGFEEEALKVFEVITPRPGTFPSSGEGRRLLMRGAEILLVGTGARGLFPPPHFKQYLNGLGIQVDVLDSVRSPPSPPRQILIEWDDQRNAGSTYNLLAEEGRRVACALYPLTALSARTGSVSS
jgi:NADH dehydrogenase [ubiquinone] 1 alpha subcomplex assembly factor 3